MEPVWDWSFLTRAAELESCQWTRGGAPVEDATEATYTLVADDAESEIAVTVTGTLDGYNSATETSEAVTVALATLESVTPTITGTAEVGETLTAVPGDWTEGTEFAYRWLRGEAPIQGATEATYTLVAADGDAQVTVEVTGTKPGYTTVVEAAAPVTVVAGDEEPGGGDPGEEDPEVPAAPSEEDVSAAPQNAMSVGPIGTDRKTTVTLPNAAPGDELTFYVYSDPQLVGTFTVSADHTVDLTLPEGLEAGSTHTLVALAADGEIVGWDAFDIAAAPGDDGDTPGEDAPAGNEGNGTGTDGLATTGADATSAALAGGLLLLAGLVFMIIARRRRQMAR